MKHYERRRLSWMPFQGISGARIVTLDAKRAKSLSRWSILLLVPLSVLFYLIFLVAPSPRLLLLVFPSYGVLFGVTAAALVSYRSLIQRWEDPTEEAVPSCEELLPFVRMIWTVVLSLALLTGGLLLRLYQLEVEVPPVWSRI